MSSFGRRSCGAQPQAVKGRRKGRGIEGWTGRAPQGALGEVGRGNLERPANSPPSTLSCRWHAAIVLAMPRLVVRAQPAQRLAA